MAVLTATQFATRAARQARQGQSPTISKIYVSQAALLLPQAMRDLATRVNQQGVQRHLLTKRWGDGSNPGIAITLDSEGRFDLDDYPQMLQAGWAFAEVYDYEQLASEPLTAMPVPFASSAHELQNAGYSGLGMFSVRGGKFYGRKADGSAMYQVSVFNVYVPDFSADYPLPEELTDDGLQILAQMLIVNAAQPEEKRAGQR